MKHFTQKAQYLNKSKILLCLKIRNISGETNFPAIARSRVTMENHCELVVLLTDQGTHASHNLTLLRDCLLITFSFIIVQAAARPMMKEKLR